MRLLFSRGPLRSTRCDDVLYRRYRTQAGDCSSVQGFPGGTSSVSFRFHNSCSRTRGSHTEQGSNWGFDTKFHRLPLIFFLVNFSCQPLRDYLPTLSCSRTCRAPFRLIFILLLAKFFFSSLFLFFINLHPLHTTFTHVIYTYIFIHAQGASANAGENFPAKTASHPGKRLRWCCSVLWDIFNRIHSSFNTLVV